METNNSRLTQDTEHQKNKTKSWRQLRSPKNQYYGYEEEEEEEEEKRRRKVQQQQRQRQRQ